MPYSQIKYIAMLMSENNSLDVDVYCSRFIDTLFKLLKKEEDIPIKVFKKLISFLLLHLHSKQTSEEMTYLETLDILDEYNLAIIE